MKQGTLNRKQYEKVRKMDHGQMQEFFTGIYKTGYEAGVKAASGRMEVPELIGLEEELTGIRGIGGAKARAVYDTVKGFLERKAAVRNGAGVEISGE